MQTATRWTALGMSAMERFNTPDVCGCCGRDGLKKTVKMGNAGQILWMGTGCAAKAAGVGIKELKAAVEAAVEATISAERKADIDDFAAFSAWVAVKGTGREYFDQLQSLGGRRVARAAYDAERAA